MQDYTKFEILIESLRQSLNHCQYENLGMPFNKDLQFAFGANWYGAMTDFWKEFKGSLPFLPKEEQKLYCNEVYYKIAWYGILFGHLKADYERKLLGNSRSKLSVETYNVVLAYSTAILDYSRIIREEAKLRGVALLLPDELTIESYKPGGTFIQSNTLDAEYSKKECERQVATTSTSSTFISTTEGTLRKGKQEAHDQPYESFVDLFINSADIEPCLQALRNYRPDKPILGEGLTWTGSIKDKGLIVAWIERLETMEPKKIKRISNRKQLVVLLNTYFEDLEMGRDASVFNKVVDPSFQDAFKALLPK
ncbi:hypothetical protein GCM10028808_10580 [Spirosoma migulaei]